ncbi:toprim domain-containing protein [Propionivibrio sp.]|uniref:toprim domain-containing protein n=1 Tax=Propionivibrio sp. TaxID=2212460 RepID=UPI002633D579|nr:toprim domain-containing protein [Propionivibrio sp.]
MRKLDTPIALDADDQALLNQIIDYYHSSLKRSPEALAYLESRGIAGEAIDVFKLGFANRTLGLRLPNKNRIADAGIRERLQKLGILRNFGHEHFNGSLVIPVIDQAGNVSEVYGRRLLKTLHAGTPRHLYLPGPHKGVWNIAALGVAPEIILCEALIDALTFWSAGYRNVTTAYGIEGFTDDILAAFKAHGTQRVLIAFDRDEAGERGAAKVAERLLAEGIDCFRIQFPKGMDANAYALKVTPASRSLGLVIRQALWLGKGTVPTHPETVPVAIDPPPTPILPTALADPSLAAKTFPAALPASPLPAAPADDAPCTVTDNEITLTFGDRRYRVRGLAKNLSFEILKVNLLATRGERFYVDTLDLYAAKQRQSYTTHAAIELQVAEDILKTDLGRVLRKLEALQEEAIRQALQPAVPPAATMDAAQRDAALSLLKAPDLVRRLLADFATCGLIGEETNKLVGYLAAVSRKLDRPLGVVIQSSSAAGKSSLMDAVLAFVPDEEKVKYSAMTGQSLFYMGETNLKHKALAIVEEEGASRASYALKLLQSEGELTIASTGKDPTTGNLITQQYRVEGPVALLLTTTARDIDEELMNRCLVLAVDEGREQTRAIHQVQRDRRTLQGLIARREKDALITLHQNAQRLLRPLDVLNPYAQFLTFPDQTTRLRRDHEKYLTLIDTIAFLHQHQRDVKTAQRGEQVIEYIEVTLADIELANRIAHDVLGRSLDELPPQTRRLLKLIDGYVVAECTRQSVKRSDFRFSRRALREAITWGDTQLRVHLERLVDLEYVLVYREGPGGKYVYVLAYEVGDESRAQVAGLIDIAALEALISTTTIPKSRGSTPEVAGGVRGGSGPVAVGSRGNESAVTPHPVRVSGDLSNAMPETHCSRPTGKSRSYPQAVPALAAASA